MSYANDADLSLRFPSLDRLDLYQRTEELSAATEWIEGHCHRVFSLDATVTVRYFAATNRQVLDLGAFEIGTNDSVVIATDDGTAAYATTVAASAYQLESVNAANVARPYTSIRSIGTTWPVAVTANSRQERIRVTARYGWPAVPEAVKHACVSIAANTLENPGGAKSESIDGYSVTYISSAGVEIPVPPLVISQLRPYIRGWAV